MSKDHDTEHTLTLYKCVDCQAIYEVDACATRLILGGEAKELYCRGCNGIVLMIEGEQ